MNQIVSGGHESSRGLGTWGSSDQSYVPPGKVVPSGVTPLPSVRCGPGLLRWVSPNSYTEVLVRTFLGCRPGSASLRTWFLGPFLFLTLPFDSSSRSSGLRRVPTPFQYPPVQRVPVQPPVSEYVTTTLRFNLRGETC